ncbi:hypothetical protein AAY473_006566 [Plecturocebus cupreus]
MKTSSLRDSAQPFQGFRGSATRGKQSKTRSRQGLTLVTQAGLWTFQLKRSSHLILLKTGFFHVVQVGLKLLASSDSPALTSQSAGIMGVRHPARLNSDILITNLGFKRAFGEPSWSKTHFEAHLPCIASTQRAELNEGPHRGNQKDERNGGLRRERGGSGCPMPLDSVESLAEGKRQPSEIPGCGRQVCGKEGGSASVAILIDGQGALQPATFLPEMQIEPRGLGSGERGPYKSGTPIASAG